jgi:hypothetical protein
MPYSALRLDVGEIRPRRIRVEGESPDSRTELLSQLHSAIPEIFSEGKASLLSQWFVT